MGQSELEAALRRNGEDKARQIWADVEEQAAQLRTETAAKLNAESRVENARCEAQLLAVEATRRTDAEQRVQLSRLTAEAALEQRLRQLAQKLLKELAAAGGAALFHGLADEIPAHDWRHVKVNRRDQSPAAERFPQAEQTLVDDISAGFEVEAEGGQIRIVNTLEKRLAHLWPELIPELMKELRPLAGDDGNVA